MAFEEFLNANQNKLFGYLMLADILGRPEILDTPYPPAERSEEQLPMLKDRLNECIPLEFMITDLWDWDIHFEKDLGDDWYAEAYNGFHDRLAGKHFRPLCPT